MLTHIYTVTTLWEGYYYSTDFTDKETEVINKLAQGHAVSAGAAGCGHRGPDAHHSSAVHQVAHVNCLVSVFVTL